VLVVMPLTAQENNVPAGPDDWVAQQAQDQMMASTGAQMSSFAIAQTTDIAGKTEDTTSGELVGGFMMSTLNQDATSSPLLRAWSQAPPSFIGANTSFTAATEVVKIQV